MWTSKAYSANYKTQETLNFPLTHFELGAQHHILRLNLSASYHMQIKQVSVLLWVLLHLRVADVFQKLWVIREYQWWLEEKKTPHDWKSFNNKPPSLPKHTRNPTYITTNHWNKEALNAYKDANKVFWHAVSLAPADTFLLIIKLISKLWTKINTKEKQSPTATSRSPIQLSNQYNY